MNRLKKTLREPLVHFLMIGAGLFLLFHFSNKSAGDQTDRIVVTPAQVRQLETRFFRTWMRPPTKEEMAGLIESHVRDEVYYREAVAMGLDRNDRTIQQRMRMKLEFLLEDLGAVAEPSDDALIAYLHAHPDRFQKDTRVSFRHVYLNPDKHQDMEADAKRVLTQVKQGVAPESVGDPILLQGEYTLATESDMERQFGEAFTRQVVALAPGAWTGPFYSGLGGHLVKVSERVERRLPELAEVRSQVEREYLAQRRRELKAQAYAKLLERYEVVIEVPKSPDEESSPVGAAKPTDGGKR
jgi:PPIC-type PPIASE domain